MKLGYALSSEEHDGNTLIKLAAQAEASGFSFAFISDHFHPWLSAQGQSEFVWSVIGAISQKTRSIKIGTAVTCPLFRYHPAIIAQAAATTASLLPGRFMLGLGAGENLNEHIVGAGWPRPVIRSEMLEEAIEITRELFKGNYVDYFGNYYTVEQAKLFSLPKKLPPILMAASGPKSTATAARLADGFISTKPDPELIKTFNNNGGKGKPKYGQVKVCYDEDRNRAREIMFRYWPNGILGSPLNADLLTPKHFEAAVKKLRIEDLPERVPVGPDKQEHINAIKPFFDAGFDYVYIHQVGPAESQAKFFRFYEAEILPNFI